MSKVKNQSRYFLFNRKTLERTGEYKAVKNVATREDARTERRTSSQVLGIFDRQRNEVIS